MCALFRDGNLVPEYNYPCTNQERKRFIEESGLYAKYSLVGFKRVSIWHADFSGERVLKGSPVCVRLRQL